MTSCNRPGCSGTIDDIGFCQACDRRPAGSGPVPPVPATTTRPGKRTGESRMVEGTVPLPILRFPDPEHRIVPVTEVPEEARWCPACGQEVGRGYAGQPALTEGFCSYDRRPFTFSPPDLQRGDLVDDRYEIVGCLARGGLGWVYLGRDRHLDDTYVVLKRLINTADPVALAIHVAERQFLTALDHSHIVRISNFVSQREAGAEGQTSYLVMEYLSGVPLADLKAHVYQYDEPLRLEHLLAYGLEILAALEYLHGRGLLYCDMKPDNVIRCADRIKIIDLGGVRRVDDRRSPVVGTPGFQAPSVEIHRDGLTVRSDLHTVGKTLEDLFTVTEEAQSATAREPVALAVESFRRLLDRAAHPERERRFGSAAELAEQLRGVAREVIALREKVEQPERSRLFTPTAELLDAGLGTVAPLAHWIARDHDDVLDPGRPPAATAAARLPAPRVAPDDPAARFLEQAPDPRSVIEKLPAFPPASVEIQFAACRAHLELAEPGDAARCLAAARGEWGDRADQEWRVAWHEGLLGLAQGDVGAADARFDAVYRAVPGEVAPKLALGFCAELAGDRAGLERAERYYRAVWWRDRSQASAAFGLARICLARGDREGAVAVLDEVPRVSRHYDAAQVAAFRVLAGRLSPGPTGLPSEADLRAAVRRLPDLRLDGGAEDGESRDRLVTALRKVALQRLLATGTLSLSGGAVLGDRPDERRLRILLERSYRALATRARDADTHGVLIDLANAVRPRTLR